MWRTTDICTNNCGCFIYCKRERMEGKGRRLFPQIGGFLQKCCRLFSEGLTELWERQHFVRPLQIFARGPRWGADRHCVVLHRRAAFEEAKTNCNSTPILISQPAPLPDRSPDTKHLRTRGEHKQTPAQRGRLSLSPETAGRKGDRD